MSMMLIPLFEAITEGRLLYGNEIDIIYNSVFMIIALHVVAMNYGKYYLGWNEFSHWENFLKESCFPSASIGDLWAKKEIKD